MENSQVFKTNRRQFLTRALPVCAASCLGASSVFANIPEIKDSLIQEDKHPFDTEYSRKLTNRQFFAVRYREFITFAKTMEKELGKEKLIEILKKQTTERSTQTGQQQAKRFPDTNFKTYVNQFRPKNFANMLVMEIVEDTDKAYEINVSDCIWAVPFIAAKAGDIGYAHICWGDYAWAESFNPKIKMVRDKTLMQGHDRCNHRYLWTG